MTKKIYNYSFDLDNETLEQFENCYKEDFVTEAALMPDAHKGYVAPIGAVLVTKKYLVPSWVGFDIGCGLIALELKGKNILEKINSSKEKIFKSVKKLVPMGLGETNKKHKVSKETTEKLSELLKKFESNPHDKKILNFIKSVGIRDIGTLGAGNHFISINSEEKQKGKDSVWLVVHCGSRGLGHRVAKNYMVKASNNNEKFEKTFPLDSDSQIGKEYLNVLDFGLEYALLNRMEIARRTKLAIEKVLGEEIKMELWVNKNHNHAIKEGNKFIHRKGATPAKIGERGIIPANMFDGSFLVEGLGNKKFLNSSSHGAGRIMSRKDANNKLSLKELKEKMKGIKTDFVLEESPEAYKDIKTVMEKQKDSVKILKHLTPIINWQQ
jgi:tRNA-splicing ligase RtcB (3'-phosphate/5'-hydroxy nucleic acid ligase)